MMINAIGIALSGLNSAAQRVNASSANIANVFSSGSLAEGSQSPYTPRDVTQIAQENGGVLAQIIPRDPAYTAAYAPDSPFANADGYIGVPNVDLATEIINLKLAEISYKSNIGTLKAAEGMLTSLLSTFDKTV